MLIMANTERLRRSSEVSPTERGNKQQVRVSLGDGDELFGGQHVLHNTYNSHFSIVL